MSSEGNTESVEDLAAAWAARIDAAPETQHPGLEEWLAQDPRHAGALLRAQAMLAMFHADLPRGIADDEDGASVPDVPAARPRARRWLAGGAVLAGIAAVVAALVLPARDLTYEAAPYEVRLLSLDDGSAVALDAHSRMEVAMASGGRRVELERGKALFRVRHDAHRPFSVAVGDVIITDIGTVFQVNADAGEDRIEVLVTEGEVEVRSAAGTTRLIAGQRGSFPRTAAASATVEKLSRASADHALGWTSGRLELDGQSLGDAIAEMNRHNPLQIRLADPMLAREPFYGEFQMNDPVGFARAVAVSVNGSAQIGPDEIAISAGKN